MPIPNPYRGLRGLPADVWIVFATTLVNRAGTMALPFLVLYLTSYLHISAPLAGLAISAYGVGGLVTAPMAGRLADRVGPFVVLRASLAATGVLLLIIPLVKSFAVVIGLTFVWAVIADAARPATMSAIADTTGPEQRKAAIAVNRLGVNLGMSVGPALGGFLAQVSFPLLFVVDGVTSLAAAAVLSTLLWRRRRSTGAMLTRHEPAPRGAASAPASSVWRDRPAMIFFATAFLLNVVFTQPEGAMPLTIVRDLHFPESFFGTLFVLNTAIIIAIEVPLNIAMAHWNLRRALASAIVLVAVGFGALAVAKSAIAIAATVVVWTFGEMIFFPTSTAYVAELAPPGRTGEYMGAFGSTFSLAMIVGPWMGVALLDRVGTPMTWTFMLGCGLVAAALALTARARGPAAVRALPD